MSWSFLTTLKPMALRYAIIGTGAIGGYYGGRLAENGNEVHFLFNSEYEFVKQNGLKIDSVNGNFIINPVNAYQSTKEMPKCDVIIIALKSTRNDILPDLLRPILHESSIVILIQNGLNLEAELATSFPNQPIAGGMAFICSSRIGQGHIFHADYGALTVGFHQHANDEVLQQIKSDFEQSKIPFTIANNLNESRWRKLVWNIPYNGLTVVLQTSTDKIMQHPQSRKLVTELMEEVVCGAEACGEHIEQEFIDKMLAMTDKMRPYSPSMKLDFDNRRPMEIRAIYTNPIMIARQNGYNMHKTEMLEEELWFIQNNYLQ